ncbi:hypothetical protein DCAR_0727227 [Daucus carota subsp. sativus]|uniref:Uncharacterized protein n=1 Tax=Daucus carota subsp. sativus TaxID=79200 RepID=A0A161X2K2_DAUCS|nr:hypothetical protein DCAR_0727227 [Daucus carota subsp. sativus]
MAYFSSLKALSTEYCSTADSESFADSESGWTNYIGDRADDGTESDDSMTSDARSSSPRPASRRFHRYNQHSDDDQVQDKLRGQATSSVSKKMQQFQKVVSKKSMKHPCNSASNINKQANHDDDQEEEAGEQLIRYQQSYRTTVGSTTDA